MKKKKTREEEKQAKRKEVQSGNTATFSALTVQRTKNKNNKRHG